MKIVCESCGAKYSIADEKVAGKVFKIRCKKCSAVIVVKGDQQPQDGAESTRVFDYGGEAIWHVVVAGDQQGPFAPRQIGELLSEGKIDWEAYVWREGMDGWQPAKDVEALVKSVMAEAEEGAEGSEPGASASSHAAARAEVFGGSSDMGADPFASSDDGGLSGVIGQTTAQASASPAGGRADLFASAGRAGLSTTDDDDVSAGRGLGGPKVSEGQALTGQRNENSVLFSLSNLQALATGSAAAPATGRPKPGMAQGEGSGLIDIRALASATQAVGDRPNTSAHKIDDLLAVGSTGSAFSATGLAAPVAVEKPHQNRLVYGMIGAIVLLGAAVTYLAVRDPGGANTAQITPAPERSAAPQSPEPPAPVAAAPTTPPSEAPQAAEPAQAPAAPTEPAAGEAKPASESEDKEAESARAERRRRSSESSSSASKPVEKPEAEPVAEAAPAKRGGDKSIDDLLDTALGSKPKASGSKPAASENLAPTPTREDVLAAMKGITPAVQGCGGGQSGVAMAKVLVTGATGKVSTVEVGGQFAGTPIAACIAKEVKKAKFPKFSQNSFSFSYPFKI